MILLCFFYTAIVTTNGAPFDFANFGAQMSQWGQNFGNQMNAWSQNFNKQMTQMNEELKQMGEEMESAIVEAKRSGNYDCIEIDGPITISAGLVWTENGKVCFSPRVHSSGISEEAIEAYRKTVAEEEAEEAIEEAKEAEEESRDAEEAALEAEDETVREAALEAEEEARETALVAEEATREAASEAEEEARDAAEEAAVEDEEDAELDA